MAILSGVGAIYGPPLARVHDAHFGGFARAAAAELVDRLQRAGIHAGRVVDLGCGSGTTAAVVGERGYDALGIDASSAMVALARGRAPEGEFRVGRIEEAALPESVGVAAIGEVMGYAAAEGPSLADMVGRVARALRAGGLFVFDLALVGRAGPTRERRTVASGEGWDIEMIETEDLDARSLTRRITLRCGEERHRETHRLRTYRVDEVTRVLDRAGFAFEMVGRYGDVALADRWRGWWATRRVPQPRWRGSLAACEATF